MLAGIPGCSAADGLSCSVAEQRDSSHHGQEKHAGLSGGDLG